jgi:hypothetical protein
MMPERSRANARSPRSRVRLRVATSHGGSFTVNVGPGGFCTELVRVLPIGTPVEGSIYLDGQDRRFTGRVAWARPGDFRLGLKGRMGIRFLDVDPGLARALAGLQGGGTGGGAPGSGAS